MVGELKMVFAVRRDLDLGKGKIAAQVAHAAVSCALRSMERQRDKFDEWMRQGQKKIVVKVPGIEDIIRIREKAASMGIIFEVVTDAGLTQTEPGTVTCIGLGPDSSERLDTITGMYHLL
ncbi:peptidyl-tRNA hydrolase [Thermogymnomonas acidicola]|uniref:Peptidyl-tRNA hydrolase n=1 Tax=Thermogymnomonas acidicola TaxID=399579 RepID=A0AA37BQR3_9ARCH|nr:peptidyl-tRNA hydrolase Pth2 [Thermogymnomonas acidicola]GGM68924.1 peptidyl-tRNA hydrolase [Thermogymnomonas acidicola]